MKFLDQIIRLGERLGDLPQIGISAANEYYVSFARIHVRDSERDIMQRSFLGYGITVEDACRNALTDSAGKILYRRDGYFGKDEKGECIEKSFTYVIA